MMAPIHQPQPLAQGVLGIKPWSNMLLLHFILPGATTPHFDCLIVFQLGLRLQ